MEYPIYDIQFDPNTDIGMTAISFVDLPAICQDFVYFSKDGKQKRDNIKSGAILMASKEKREVISPILIPNQLILRGDENGKYYNRWTKEVIEQIATYYLLNQYNNNFTEMHQWMFGEKDGEYEESFIKGVYMLRMWIIADAKTDEANAKYGYHLPEGTLMVHLKIHNKKLWNKIKKGEIKGLSIEAFVPSKMASKINYNKIESNMSKKNKVTIDSKAAKLFSKFMLWYNQTTEDVKALEDLVKDDETESGVPTVKYFTSETDFIEVLSDGSCVDQAGEPVGDGQYTLYDGSVLVIENGVFSKTVVMEDADASEPEEAPIAESCDGEEDEDKKEDEEETQSEEEDEEEKSEETSDETVEEDKKEEEETQEEVEAPYTLVPVMVGDVEFQVPIEVADYIASLEEQLAGSTELAENFRKEIAQYQKRMPSTKPVQTVVKEENKKEDKVEFTAQSLFERLNKKLY